MNLALKPWTTATFLAWDERQELRHEFDGFRPIAMTGGSVAHDTVQINLVTELNTRLRGKPCRARGGGLRIEAMGSIRHPDAFVTRTPIDRRSAVVRDPVVIFEILSRSSARIDRTDKNREYAGIASVVRYVMLEQETLGATVFSRGPGGAWTGETFGPGASLRMPEIDVDLPLDDLYAGLDFSDLGTNEDEAVSEE